MRAIEYELVEHRLTPEQVRIYDAYAGAFQVIHNNLDAALQAANVTGESGTLNDQAKSAARSAFESAKQRFFNHLITSMKTPTLIAAVERDLEAGHAAVIQIVSTGEALMERRLCRDSDRGMGRRPGRHHAARIRSRLLWRTAFRPSSSSLSPTARATSRLGRSTAMVSRSNAARPSSGAIA